MPQHAEMSNRITVPGDLHNSDPAYRDALSSLRAIPSTTYVSLAGKFSTAPPLFSAPCLEVVTFYGIDDGFPKQVEQFVAALNDAAKSMEGYHGAVYGEVAARQPASETEEAAHGRERDVVLLIGWDSKDAHLKAKGIEGGGEWLDICPGWHLVKGSS